MNRCSPKASADAIGLSEASERRAQSVVSYLVGQGVDAARITSVGYGEGHPVATNDTETGRSLNRRVDLLLKAKAR